MKISYFQSFLEGAAFLWFEKYQENARNHAKTWTDVKEDFIQEFGTSDTKISLEKKLYNREQGADETIREYYFDLLNLFGEYDPSLDLDNFKKYFENGLSKDLYTHYRLIVEDRTDWKGFKKMIDQLEDIALHTHKMKKESGCE